jgi:hypothetical protein
MFLLTEYFGLEYPYLPNMLYWNILTYRVCCTGISVPTYRIFSTRISLLTLCFVMEHPYLPNIFYWNILTH